MDIQKITWVFAVVFILVGILGFVPGVTTSSGHLLGIFEVSALHNIIHLLTGIVAAAAAHMGSGKSSLFFKVFGVVYAVVTVVGFVQGNTVLGLIGVNLADNVLHLVIAAAALWLGFGMKDTAPMPSAPAPTAAPGGDTPGMGGGGNNSGMGGGQPQ